MNLIPNLNLNVAPGKFKSLFIGTHIAIFLLKMINAVKIKA